MNKSRLKIYTKLTPLLIVSLALLIIATYLRFKSSDLFYSLRTFQFSASSLTRDVAHPKRLLFSYFLMVIRVYVSNYFLPVFLILLPSILLFSYVLYKTKGSLPNPGKYLKRKDFQVKMLVIVALIALGVFLTCKFAVMRDFPLVSDEFSFLFQSDLISRGKLFAKSPPMHRFFQCDNIVNNGKWYSKYTIGWPLLLAAGKKLGIKFLIAPLFGVFTLIILYLLARQIFSAEAGLLALCFCIFSPFFFLMASSYFSHTAAGFFTLSFLYALMRTLTGKKRLWSFLAGISIVFLLLIRSGNGLAIFIGAIPFWFLWKDTRLKFREKAARFTIIALFFIIALGILAQINKIQSGNLFTFGFTVYDPGDLWGFGVMGHNFSRGMWNLFFSLVRNSFWTVPFLLFFNFISLFRRERKVYLIVAPMITITAFYFAHHSLGNAEIGARYYYSSFLLSTITAAAGVLYLKKMMKRFNLAGYENLIPSLIIFIFIYTTVGVSGRIVPRLAAEYKQAIQVHDRIKNAGQEGKSLIFIRNGPGQRTRIFTRNYSNIDDLDQLLAIYLLPKENEKLTEIFRGRKPYLIYFDYTKGKFESKPYPVDSYTASDYIFAGENYENSLRNYEKAEAAYKKAANTDPDHPLPLLKLGQMYYETARYTKAAAVLKKQVEKFPQIPAAYYYLGRTLGKLGKKEEAIEVLVEFTGKFPKALMVEKAKDWILYYSGN